MPTVCVTGANRGIGLEFVKQYLNDGWQVHACCRNPEQATELQALASNEQLQIHPLDVTNDQQIETLKQQLTDCKLDLLINNAGIAGETGVSLENFNADNFRQVMEVNAIAPFKLLIAFRDCLNQGELKTVVNISSRMGSIADNDSGRRYAYRTSKTALNALMHTASIDLSGELRVLLLHPGWVKTDMGGEDGLVTATESVGAMRALIADPKTQSGAFYHFQGEQLPW